jgi:hypothetical protein
MLHSRNAFAAGAALSSPTIELPVDIGLDAIDSCLARASLRCATPCYRNCHRQQGDGYFSPSRRWFMASHVHFLSQPRFVKRTRPMCRRECQRLT